MDVRDSHCHLGFCTNAEEIARQGAACGVSFLSCTVRPEDFEIDLQRFGDIPTVQVGLGFHPWWVQGVAGADCEGTFAQEQFRTEETLSPTSRPLSEKDSLLANSEPLFRDSSDRRSQEHSSFSDSAPCKVPRFFRLDLLERESAALSPFDQEQLELFCRYLPQADFVGEIGLDFGTAHQVTADAQRIVFQTIVHLCAQEATARTPDHPLTFSVHAVKSASEVLDTLQDAGLCNNPKAQVVLHWFSGTSDELQRALQLGCWFSVGERMVATKRGRTYVDAIKAFAQKTGTEPHLLVETDFPPEGGPDDQVFCNPETWFATLRGGSTISA